MARYELRHKASVEKDLRLIPKPDVQRIIARIESLRDDPRPPGVKKLSTQERCRVRQGNYRILYTITDVQLIVEVVKIGHRRDVYRDS
jgi:mRNA interferase RelE/StbE